MEDQTSFVKRRNAYRDDDSTRSRSSRIADEGSKDKKGPDTSTSLIPSKTPQPKVREVVAKGKQPEATGVAKTDGVLLQSVEDYAAHPEHPPSSRTQPRAPEIVPSKPKVGFHNSNSDAENQAKSFSKSPTPSIFMTPPEDPVDHSKRKRSVVSESPSPLSLDQRPASKRM